MTESRCTFHRPNGPVCGRVAEDETVHSAEDERMRPGTHLWRHDAKDERLLTTRPSIHTELDVMEHIASLLDPLPSETQQRIAEWLVDKYTDSSR